MENILMDTLISLGAICFWVLSLYLLFDFGAKIRQHTLRRKLKKARARMERLKGSPYYRRPTKPIEDLGTDYFER
jgi:uncharacterized membrane protein YciS (DUF1049 family)